LISDLSPELYRLDFNLKAVKDRFFGRYCLTKNIWLVLQNLN